MPNVPRTSARPALPATVAPRSGITADGLPLPDERLITPDVPLAPEIVPTTTAIRTTYRQLTLRGLAAPEASNLTAFLAGLPPEPTAWTLGQLNRLLFLRHLYATSGEFAGRAG